MTRAQIKHDRGDINAAIADYGAVLKHNPKNVAALNAHAMALMQTKDYAKAADDFDHISALDPKNAQVYYQRGLAREQIQQFDRAMADFKLALAHDRNLDDARRALTRATAEDRQ